VEQGEFELAADDGGHAREQTCRVAKSVQAGSDHRLDALGER